ncbi:MAG: hypothetical protein ACO3FE_07175 [Planctomycetaceae bacterium]
MGDIDSDCGKAFPQHQSGEKNAKIGRVFRQFHASFIPPHFDRQQWFASNITRKEDANQTFALLDHQIVWALQRKPIGWTDALLPWAVRLSIESGFLNHIVQNLYNEGLGILR